MAPRKIIIDTDPGVDDVLAMLLAFSALPEELEILLLSVTYGNIDLQNCLRNVISMFWQVEQEIEWRKSQGRHIGFEALRKRKPLIALGPAHPLSDQLLMADFFHGRDGLGGIHTSHPHLSPSDAWRILFEQAEHSNDITAQAIAAELRKTDPLFMPSQRPASDEILRLLRENEPDTVTIIAIGPLTNLAITAAQDPETFLRVKEIVVMGGTINEQGNITPVAEFNTFADSIAAARLYALSSAQPQSTMPPHPPMPAEEDAREALPPYLAPYPMKLSRRLKITLFPLDITNHHLLTRGQFRAAIDELLTAKSPLAEWTSAFLTATFNKVESLQRDVSGDAVGLQLHDPLCVWYCMSTTLAQWTINEDEDIRVETSGQWTRGMCVVDRRTRRKRDPGEEGEKPGDSGNWLSRLGGNRIGRCTGSPGKEAFGEFLLRRIFGLI